MKGAGERELEQAGRTFRPRGRSDVHAGAEGGGRLGRKSLSSRATLRNLGSSSGELHPEQRLPLVLVLVVTAKPGFPALIGHWLGAA